MGAMKNVTSKAIPGIEPPAAPENPAARGKPELADVSSDFLKIVFKDATLTAISEAKTPWKEVEKADAAPRPDKIEPKRFTAERFYDSVEYEQFMEMNASEKKMQQKMDEERKSPLEISNSRRNSR